VQNAIILFSLLAQDRFLAGLHQTGAAGSPQKQSYFLETQLTRPISERFSSIGTLRITTARAALLESGEETELVQAAEFQTGVAVRLSSRVDAVAHFGATGSLSESRFRQQYAAGFRLGSTYQVTVGQDHMVTRRGPVVRVELTQRLAGTPFYLLAHAAIGMSGHPHTRDTYRIGFGVDLANWYRRR
jgi:hypothetical protein